MNSKNERKVVFNKYSNVLKITLTAVFSALCFAVMFLPKVYIPSPIGEPYIHFGNLVVILVALLFGGPIGGASGAIGMGIYDLIKGYGIWTIKTIVLKFVLGFVVGLIYKFYKNRDKKNVFLTSIILSVVFFAFSISCVIVAIINQGILVIGSKNIAISWPLYVFSFVLGAFLFVSAILSKNKNRKIQIALLAGTCGVVINILGEFVGKLLKSMLTGEGFIASVVLSVASLPATIINGCISIVFVMILFPILDKALKEVSLMNDDKDA